MNILFFGDVVGKSGRECLYKYLKPLVAEHKVDFVIVNGENATHGFGIMAKHCVEFFENGVNAITLGNHAFDHEDIKEFINQNNNVLRPINLDLGDSIKGELGIYEIKNQRIMVINLLGQLMMYSKIPLLDPFAKISEVLSKYQLKKQVDVIIVDFHAETTSEKNAMGYYLDGKVSAVLGTHTHIPTLDERILPKGTAYRTDVGMCGDYNSVIGMDIQNCVQKFTNKNLKVRLFPAEGLGTVSATLITINEDTGLCSNIQNIFIKQN